MFCSLKPSLPSLWWAVGNPSSFCLRPARLASVLVIVCCLGWWAFAVAGPNEASRPGGHLIITKVEVDFDAKQLIISGEDFNFVNTLEVTLGEFENLVIDS